jgi:hypothetical protein
LSIFTNLVLVGSAAGRVSAAVKDPSRGVWRDVKHEQCYCVTCVAVSYHCWGVESRE